VPRMRRRLCGAHGAGEVYGAWKTLGGERRVAAGELRLLLPGRHSEVRGDLWMPPKP
jgi:hypothetical protein